MFDLEKFKKEFESGDIWGLEYLERTIINDMKEKNKGTTKMTKEDYILSLFYAVKDLNYCNNIYETTNVENHFNWEYYYTIRDLLFLELDLLKELI